MDIRIGNWLKHPEFTKPYFQWQAADFLRNDVIKKAEPIPLTTEILQNLGFKIEIFKDEDEILIHPAFGLSGGYFTTDLIPNRIFWDKYPQAETKYVHQLQNLFYALTGLDFNIKL